MQSLARLAKLTLLGGVVFLIPFVLVVVFGVLAAACCCCFAGVWWGVVDRDGRRELFPELKRGAPGAIAFACLFVSCVVAPAVTTVVLLAAPPPRERCAVLDLKRLELDQELIDELPVHLPVLTPLALLVAVLVLRSHGHLSGLARKGVCLPQVNRLRKSGVL